MACQRIDEKVLSRSNKNVDTALPASYSLCGDLDMLECWNQRLNRDVIVHILDKLRLTGMILSTSRDKIAKD
jgi:hypothetical protein